MMPYNLTPEQLALYGVARFTWHRRGVAKHRGLSFGEESVTETILMDLAETFPGPLRILQFSKAEEGKNGADWAWLFQSADGSQNLPMLVQAKALDQKDLAYPEIKRVIGKLKPPIRQIDRLITTAKSWKWPAIYAFYNHLDDTTRIPDVCKSLPASSTFGLIAESWGVSIADAEAVRNLLNDQSFDSHRHHSRPLHCLLCSGGKGVRPAGGSPELARRFIADLRAGPDGVEAASSWRSDPDLELREEPPGVFREAMSILDEDDRGDREARVEALAQEFPGLAGVVVLQDAKT